MPCSFVTGATATCVLELASRPVSNVPGAIPGFPLRMRRLGTGTLIEQNPTQASLYAVFCRSHPELTLVWWIPPPNTAPVLDASGFVVASGWRLFMTDKQQVVEIAPPQPIDLKQAADFLLNPVELKPADD